MNTIHSNDWGYIELKKDPHFKDFSSAEKEMIILDAISFGNEMAKNIIDRMGQPLDFSDIKVIIEHLGGKVKIYEKPFSPIYLADYDEGKKEVTCYSINIENAMIKMGWNNPVLKHYNLFTLCAAHELFHHIENINSTRASSRIHLEKTFFKFFKYKYNPQSAREIAAHAFVQKLLDLDISPAIMVTYV